MCGIVGVIAKNPTAVKTVLQGLTRLEYRGYDSSGICFLQDDTFQVYKRPGKIEELLSTLKKVNLDSPICLGHTRWATHGAVNTENAHPHTSEEISIVHNGIIENANQLKRLLLDEGEMFSSQTDSEVFLVLVSKALRTGKDFKSAVVDSFKQIEGNSAFVVLQRQTGDIISIKRGAPIVVGSNTDGELSVSSDPFALVGVASELYFPEDNILVYLSKENKKPEFLDLNLKNSQKFLLQKQTQILTHNDKGHFDHYMIKEIFEQPELMRDLLEFYLRGEGKNVLKKIIDEADIRRVLIVACGTAYYAGLVMKRYFEQFNKLYTTVELASEFRYDSPLLKKYDGAIFISQSGETADTLAAQALVKEQGIPTLAIVNVAHSTLYRNCDYNLEIRAGQEVGVASTKAYTQMVLTGYFLSRMIQGELLTTKVEKEVNLLIQRVNDLLKDTSAIKSLSQKLVAFKGFVFTGRNKYFPVALEGALKLKEIAYVHAEGIASGELKHGPIALIDDHMVNIAIVGPELFEKTLSNVEEVKARKGFIVIFGPDGNTLEKERLATLADVYIPIDFEGLDHLSPLLVNIHLQLLAYYFALFKGTDIDRPRNLAKSVTVE